MSLEYTMGERYIKEDVLKGCVGRGCLAVGLCCRINKAAILCYLAIFRGERKSSSCCCRCE